VKDGDTYLSSSTWQSNYDFRGCGITVRSSNWWKSCDRLTGGDLITTCEHFLGVIPQANVVLGNTIKLSWLNNTFQQLPDDAMDDVVAYYAQALFTLIRSLLMPNTLGNCSIIWPINTVHLDFLHEGQCCFINWRGSVVNCVVVPLIYFATIEFHQANRLMWQFGFRQYILVDPLNLDHVYKNTWEIE